MALEDLMIPKKDSNNPEVLAQEIQSKQEFTLKFLSNGGFSFLFDIFSTLNKKNLETDIIKTKILTILLRLLS